MACVQEYDIVDEVFINAHTGGSLTIPRASQDSSDLTLTGILPPGLLEQVRPLTDKDYLTCSPRVVSTMQQRACILEYPECRPN